MNRGEVKNLVLKIIGLYPTFKPLDLTVTIDAWWSELESDDPRLINDALTVYCRTSNSAFAPSIAQLRGLIAAATVPDIDEGAIKTRLTLASRNANYGFEDEFKKMDPLLRQAVGSSTVIRSWGILEPDQLEFEFGRVIRSYRNLVDQQRAKVSMHNGPVLDVTSRPMIENQG